MNVQEKKPISRTNRLNDEIRASRIRVIGEDGKQLGVMDRMAAIQMAKDQDLDLIEVASEADPPIAKIADWGKYNYNKIKQQKKNRKNSKAAELKQVRFSLKIGDHDLDIKLNKTLKFIEQGHKVKFSLMYRGREQAHKELGFQLSERIINTLGDRIVVDQPPTLAGKQLSFVIRSNGNAKVKNP